MWNSFEVKTSILSKKIDDCEKFTKNPDYYSTLISEMDNEKREKIRNFITTNPTSVFDIGGITTIIFNGELIVNESHAIDYFWSELLQLIEDFLGTNKQTIGFYYSIEFILEPMKNNQLISFTTKRPLINKTIDYTVDDFIIKKRITPHKKDFFDKMIKEAQELFEFLNSLQLGGNLNYNNQLETLKRINLIREKESY